MEDYKMLSALQEVQSFASDSAYTKPAYLRVPFCDCQGDGVCEACRALDFVPQPPITEREIQRAQEIVAQREKPSCLR